MAGNQQFCLRWNNHQSTLISVFDNLLESGTLVDCTLAAEGQYLKAHKVVLSACSPFFEGLFSQHYEKHPIIILKDVTFSELKAMLDYMYRGEVNISQEQLGTFLKAAESLQIKGLTDNSSAGLGNIGNNGIQELHRRQPSAAAVYDLPRKIPPLSKSPCFPPHGLVVEQRPLKLTNNNNNNNNVDSPPGSNLLHGQSTNTVSTVHQRPIDATTTSPKRMKRRYSDDNTVDATDLVTAQCTVTESPHPLALSTAVTGGAGDNHSAYVKVETKPDLNHDDSGGEEGQYDDDDEEEMDLSKPGTSQHNSHPPGVWNASLDSNSEDQFPPGGSQEQEASWMLVTRPLVQTLKGGASSRGESGSGSIGGGSNRSNASQSGSTAVSAAAAAAGGSAAAAGGSSARNITCPTCNKCYSSQHTLRRHIRLECGKEPQFHCPYCPRKTKQRYNLMLHIARAHKPEHHLQSTPQPPTSHW